MGKGAFGTRKIGFDPAKSAMNIADPTRGFGFESAERFEFELALIVEDDRRDYGETRYVAIGPLDERIHVIVFTLRNETLWVISLRKANKREINRYVEYLESR